MLNNLCERDFSVTLPEDIRYYSGYNYPTNLTAITVAIINKSTASSAHILSAILVVISIV